LAPVTAALGETSVGAALHALAGRIGAPRSLAELGLPEAELDRAAAIAVESPYWNPRPVDRAAIRRLLGAAWAGEPPAG
jgi:maleylacetate reductase